MFGFLVVLHLILAEVSRHFADEAVQIGGVVVTGAGVLGLLDTLPDFAHGDLGHVEVQLFVLQQLEVRPLSATFISRS